MMITGGPIDMWKRKTGEEAFFCQNFYKRISVQLFLISPVESKS